MRPLLISVVTLAVALTASAIFINFADEDVHQMVAVIDQQVMPAVLNEDWDTAKESFQKAQSIWQRHKTAYIFFSDASAVQETEMSFHRMHGYLSGEDKADCAGELSSLKRHLLFLHEYEIISIENVI